MSVVFAPEPAFVTFTPITCGVCHVHFALESGMQADREKDGRDFHCPNGHVIHYHSNENARLKKQIEQLTKLKTWAEEREQTLRAENKTMVASLRATRGVVTRIKKRVRHGVCPCCKRNFQDLARHMSCKHPKYGYEE